MFRRRIKYLIRSLFNITQKKKCPYCGEADFVKIGSKFVVTSLYKCKKCCLNHRHPKDSEEWLNKFYNEDYSIDQDLMTDLPNDEELKTLANNNFSSQRNYDQYLKALFPSKIKIVDYGCSWGYNVFKLIQSGHNAVGFELSKNRALFGEKKLGISIFSEKAKIPTQNDVILSSHVIEHLVDIKEFIDFSRHHLHGDGIFMAFCPNGNDEYRQREPEIWNGSWGDIHINLIDYKFAKYLFRNNPYLIISDDWTYNFQEIKNWDGLSQKIGDKLDGKELLIISKPNINI